MISPGRRIGGDWPMSGDALLRVWTATVAEGTPQALDDHSEVRWLEPDQLATTSPGWPATSPSSALSSGSSPPTRPEMITVP